MKHLADKLDNTFRPYSVGFDDILSRFEHMTNASGVTYPPYDIIKVDETTYNINIAAAGFSRDDIDISYQNNILTIKGNAPEHQSKKEQYIHKGISRRSFTRDFNLADSVKVNDASFVDGMLTVTLEKIVPEEKRARKIFIK